MKISHLTSVHPAFDTRIFHKECRTLVQAGHEVTLIAPHDHDETVKGVRIKAVPRPKNRLHRMTGTVWRVFRAALKERAGLYHFHDPELIPIGVLLKLFGKTVIYDVHEDLPRQTLGKYWIPGWMRPLVMRAAELAEYIGPVMFDGVIGATPAIARRFPRKKTVIVRNFPLLDEFMAVEARPYTQRAPVIVYIGGLNEFRGLNEMVKAVGLRPGPPGVCLKLAGNFSPPGLEAQMSLVPGWEKVEYLGWQSREGVARLLAEARIGLVLLHPRPNYLTSLPVKLFEYMAAGIPAVASDFPLWRGIVQGAGCGLLVDPLDPRAVSEAISWLLENPKEAEAMGRRGREAVLRYYNWNSEAKKLLELYEKLSGRGAGRGVCAFG